MLALEAARAQVVARPDVDFGAELGKRVDVRIEPPPSDHVAAGRRHDRLGRSARGAAPRAGRRRGSGSPSSPSSSCPSRSRGVDADLVRARPLDVGAELGEQRDHRLDVADPRHVRERHRLVGEQAGREDRQRAVLVPGRARSGRRADARPRSRTTRRAASATTVCGMRRGILAPVEPTREHAWETLTGTRRARRCCATRSRSRPRWAPTRGVSARTRSSGGSTALLHDFDYEIHPTLDKHPQDGAPILREEGYPEEVIEACPLARLAPRPAARHAAEEDALRLRRAGRLRPRLRPRAARRDRHARAEVGEEEAQAAVVRGRRQPRRRLRGRRGCSGSSSTSTSPSWWPRCGRSRPSSGCLSPRAERR